jgi:hypothetical protein
MSPGGIFGVVLACIAFICVYILYRWIFPAKIGYPHLNARLQQELSYALTPEELAEGQSAVPPMDYTSKPIRTYTEEEKELARHEIRVRLEQAQQEADLKNDLWKAENPVIAAEHDAWLARGGGPSQAEVKKRRFPGLLERSIAKAKSYHPPSHT